MLSYALPIKDAQQQIAGGVWVLVDITDRKRAERIIRVANERKDKFLAVLAHELRNPLALIRSALALLGEAENDSETANWARGLMDQQMEHMVRLVDDLLDVSRIAQGKIELRKETVELHRLVVQAVEMARPVIDAQRHLLHLPLPEELIWIEADPVRMVPSVFQSAEQCREIYAVGRLDFRVDPPRRPDRGSSHPRYRHRHRRRGIASRFRFVHPSRAGPQSVRKADWELASAWCAVSCGCTVAKSPRRVPGRAAAVNLACACRWSPRRPQPMPQTPLPEAARRLRLLVVDDQIGQAQILARVLEQILAARSASCSRWTPGDRRRAAIPS